MHRGVVYALLAATLFGASTPFSKILVGQMAPVMLAGLLYLGSGLGLLAWYSLRFLISGGKKTSGDRLTKSDLPWLGGAILTGGIAGPVLLMIGLTLTPASSASLLLNIEGVLTALLAWFVFKENFDRRIFAGMILIVMAGVLLSLGGDSKLEVPWGALAIVAACLCWAIDNNLTRKVSASDAVQIAGIKGLVAGSVNLSIALALGYSIPDTPTIFSASVIGFCGYGLSLVMFVLALRHLGTARTGAYFSAAPFVGAVVSLLILGETPNTVFWIAAALMGAGIWLHVTETHGHEHTHLPLSHAHAHRHDAHHQHEHDFPWDGKEPHVHPHEHETLTHSHEHFPDINHRHKH
ncbi:DMT family transporter [Herminiimonas contaminans]|jgi:drug/metabolite transporter (DMT)-like permease|uniref:DMT family transporter n=1 Tax=Herminiimonas contaminans TaxID=1111140 RepID=A0ABS0EWE0_9BURK|nr:DMT family transporter [Herminiimonas contaminans]MBF8179152.1 DMT family transporter [Herminiimonas contaminans]